MKARLVKRFCCFSALCAALAEVLGSKVCLSRDKFNTMCCLESEQVRKLITTDWKAARVHVLPMMQITFKVSAAAPAHPHKWCTFNCGIFKIVTGLHRFRNHCLTSDTFSLISFRHFLFLSVCRSCRITWPVSPASTTSWWPSSPPAGPSASRWSPWRTFSPTPAATSPSTVEWEALQHGLNLNCGSLCSTPSASSATSLILTRLVVWARNDGFLLFSAPCLQFIHLVGGLQCHFSPVCLSVFF